MMRPPDETRRTACPNTKGATEVDQAITLSKSSRSPVAIGESDYACVVHSHIDSTEGVQRFLEEAFNICRLRHPPERRWLIHLVSGRPEFRLRLLWPWLSCLNKFTTTAKPSRASLVLSLPARSRSPQTTVMITHFFVDECVIVITLSRGDHWRSNRIKLSLCNWL